MPTPVTSISGIGPHTAKILKENGYGSAEAIASTTASKLSEVQGFGLSRSKVIIAAARDLLGTATIDQQKSVKVKENSKMKSAKKKKKEEKKAKKVSEKPNKKDKKDKKADKKDKKEGGKKKLKKEKNKKEKKKKVGKSKKKKK